MLRMATTVQLGVVLFLSYSIANADAFDDCVDKKIADFKKIEDFSRDGKVRCEGGGLNGKSDTKESKVSFSAAPGYQLVGNITIKDVSNNRGKYGAAVYEKDATGKVVKVEVPISCSSPSKRFGPGAWMQIKISGKVELPPSEKDLKSIFKSCINKL